MDVDGVEVVDINALGGADTTTVNDLGGTDVTEVDVALAVNGVGDGAADNVVVNGTAGDDVILAAGDANGTTVVGLAAQVDSTGAEAANDTLTLHALAGDDVIEASGLVANAIRLVETGGNGDDVLIGGPGNDVLDGGPGNNVVIQSPDVQGNTVRSATVVGTDWLAAHARVVNGETVIDVGGTQRTLSHTTLSQLIQDATSS